MFCKYCGNNIADDYIFCPACGKNLGGDAPQQYTSQQQHSSSQAPMQALILERKFDLQALSLGVHIILDGEEVARLGSKGGSLAVPVSPGTHEIGAVVKQGKKIESIIDKALIHIGNHNMIVQFSIHRTAWSACWQMKAMEDVNNATRGVTVQY